ncbi:MAG: 5-oxoprolinase subunit PxpA [Gammaproteobacteria bacterium]|nr:5-oxoprolinase subunit PxpA [Gammaproteobacteria bacterium]
MREYFIDINCDLGEGISQQDCDNDELLMPYISSCNIACGGHAGNAFTMRTTLLNAKNNSLKIGAHPGYPDKENFGRQSINLTELQLTQTLVAQINSLLDIAEQENISVKHIKFHGALYNDAENISGLANRLAKIIHQFFPSQKIVGLAGGLLETACQELGLLFLAEGFMDRAYLANSKLVSRSVNGAIYDNQETSINQAIALATNKPISTNCDRTITPIVDTICLHGDNPLALPLIKELSHQFENAGITIR